MFRTKVENHWKENYYFSFQIHPAISIVKFNWTWSLHGWAVTSPPLLWRLITLLMNSLKGKDSSLRLGSHERRFFRIHKCYWIHQFYGYRIQPIQYTRKHSWLIGYKAAFLPRSMTTKFRNQMFSDSMFQLGISDSKSPVTRPIRGGFISDLSTCV